MIPHLIHGLEPGIYSATTTTEVYYYAPASAAGSIAFIGPDSCAMSVQRVDQISGVPEPGKPPVPVKPAPRKGWFDRLWTWVIDWLMGR